MGVDMKVKAIYDSEIGNITRSEKNWKDVLKVAGQLYRYEFDNIVMVTAQRPPEKSTLMADYDTWKKVGRYVKRGAKGCAIFPSRALNPRMRYIFDISDTGGKNVKLTWDLEGENLKDYVDFLVSEGQIEQYDNSDRESLKNILKQFTGTDVWLIIKEEFGDRMTELMQLSGSVIKEESKKRNGLQQEMDMEQLVYASVMYAVGTRCGFDLSVQEQDFSQIVNIKDEEIIYRLGSIVCDVSCSVLREFSRNLKAIESERRIGYVRRNDLQGSGRTALSADRDAGRDGGSHEAGQIRKDGDELSKGERAGKIQDADEIREDVREDVSGRGGSEPAVRPAGDAVSGEAQATESVIDNGDVEDKRAGEDAGRGSGTESDSDAIPLESDDTELNRELDEINSLGVSKEAEYTQASFFFDQNGQASIGTIHTEDENNNQFMRQFEQDRKAALAGKYNYLNPKKSATVPSEYIKQVLMRGTGFIGGKGRVCKIFETEIDAGTRAKRIKAEYGQGGAGWPVDGLGLHGYDTFHGNGLRFQWRDEDGEVEGYVSWKDIEKELGVLILTGEYQPETPRIDELAMDGLREDDEVIDAEYREVEPEEAESEIDDYAIPDEPESYASNRDYVSAKGMTPQEAADEDRMVTQAEYGAEIEAETTEKDPSELQYITPIDYAKRIEELDEDLRDAAEILVTDCSCYTPFRAFLMDVVQSDFAFMPNKLDLIRDIALGTDNAERKAYSNNKYGLVEYSIRSGYVKISYKNRNGVRKEGALDWRELYEILSYMVKQPFYCGEDQKKYYQETKQKADRDKMNPVYKRFFDIEDSVKANRLETRERAIANGWETKIDENGHVVSDDAVQKKHNFHYNLWEMEKGGAKTRYQWNMDAIRTLKQIESENRLATPEEQKTLSKFVGWGGLSQAFDENNAGWSKEYAELKDLCAKIAEQGITPWFMPGADGWQHQLAFFQIGGVYEEATPGLYDALNTNQATFADNEKMLEVLNEFKELSDAGYFGEDWIGTDSTNLTNEFGDRTCAMAMANSSYIKQIKDDTGSEDEYGMFLIPLGDNTWYPTSPAGPTMFGYKGTEHEDLVREFFNFVTTTESLQEILDNSPAYTNLDVNDDNLEQHWLPEEEEFLETVDKDKMSVSVLQNGTKYTNDYWMQFGQDMIAFCQGEMEANDVLANMDTNRAEAAKTVGDENWE